MFIFIIVGIDVTSTQTPGWNCEWDVEGQTRCTAGDKIDKDIYSRLLRSQSDPSGLGRETIPKKTINLSKIRDEHIDNEDDTISSSHNLQLKHDVFIEIKLDSPKLPISMTKIPRDQHGDEEDDASSPNIPEIPYNSLYTSETKYEDLEKAVRELRMKAPQPPWKDDSQTLFRRSVSHPNIVLCGKIGSGKTLLQEIFTSDCGGMARSVLYKHKEINKKELFKMCKKYGRTSPEVTDACEHIRMHILACSITIKEVLPMYKPSDQNSIVFVVFCKSGSYRKIKLLTLLSDFEIECRTIGEYSNEDKGIPTKQHLFSKTEQTDQKNLTDILRKTSNHLMKKHSNLNIMTASPVKSKDFVFKKNHVKRKPCIVFYVRVKGYIPIQEEEFPRHLGSYTTDVREGEFTLYNDPDTYTQRLKIGCSIGEDIKNSHFGGSWGTLGAFVDLGQGSVGCITSAHALMDETHLFEFKDKKKKDNPNATSTIYQPAPTLVPINDKQPFGRVTSVVYKTGGPQEAGVEVGLITITDKSRYPENGRFPKVAEGFNEDNQLNYMSGSVLQALPEDIGQYTFYKYGAKTGLTRGAFKLQANAVRTNGKVDVRNKCELHNQIEVCSVDSKPFAEPGDSGALVLLAPNNDITNLYAIGILTGGNETMFYVTPVWEVLKALELPLQLKQFNQHTLMETGDENVNAVLPSEIEAIKLNIEEVKTNFEKELKTVGKKIGNVETKVDKTNSELTANMGKLGLEMTASADKLGCDMNNKVDKLGSDMNTKVDKLSSDMNNKVDKLGSDMNTKVDKLGSDMSTKVDKVETLGSDTNTKVDKLGSDIKELLAAVLKK